MIENTLINMSMCIITISMLLLSKNQYFFNYKIIRQITVTRYNYTYNAYLEYTSKREFDSTFKH